MKSMCWKLDDPSAEHPFGDPGSPRDPKCLALLEFAIPISLNCKDPLASDKVLRLEGLDVNEVEHIVIKPTFHLGRFCFNKEFGIDLEFLKGFRVASCELGAAEFSQVAARAHTSIYESTTKL